MELGDSPDEAAFREGVRAWLGRTCPPASRGKWSRKIYDAGYAGLTWPEEYGGRGAPYSHQAIVLEEFARAEAPPHMGVIGLGMAGPTIMAHGTEEQKQRYLSKILSAEEIWCQGFSEPGAGSDLSAVRTSIDARNGSFVVNGQKVWSSFAHIADHCILVGRSDPDSQRHDGPDLHHRRHEGARRRGAPAAPDHRRGRVQRDLPHGRRGAEGEPSRRDRRRLAGRDDDAPPRARNARLRARRRAGAAGAEARRAHEGEGRRRPDHPRPRRPGVDRAPGAEDDELPVADDADEDRDPRPRGLRLQAALVGAEPAADQARDGDPRRRGRRLLAATSSCGAAATRSRRGPPRSCETSSPSACSASRGAR